MSPKVAFEGPQSEFFRLAESRWRWLASTAVLQREAYGHVAVPDNARETAGSVRDNVLALIVEAVEVVNRVSWKTWAHDDPWVNREEVLKEAVDVGHFLANILVAIGVTDEEWETAYQAKQQENRQRQLDGYSVRKESR